jgi:hypothetical protein
MHSGCTFVYTDRFIASQQLQLPPVIPSRVAPSQPSQASLQPGARPARYAEDSLSTQPWNSALLSLMVERLRAAHEKLDQASR